MAPWQLAVSTPDAGLKGLTKSQSLTRERPGEQNEW